MGKLGPHEGKELQLMLSHKKKIALFYTDAEPPDEFFPYINNGIFLLQTINLNSLQSDSLLTTYYLIFRQEHIELAEELALTLIENYSTVFRPDLERKIGRLLGYHPDDIEYFIKHASRNYKK